MLRGLLPTLFLLGAGLPGCVAENEPLLPEGGGGSGQSSSSGCADTDCSGTCTNLNEDPLNCGACGHDCFGGTCDAGVCQPVVLVTGLDAQHVTLAVDETHLYWGLHADNKGLFRAKIDGSEPETLSTTANAQPFSMVVDATHLYWARRQGDHTVMRMPKNGGAEAKLADASYPTAVAVDAEFVYWVNYWLAGDNATCTTGEIRKVPLTGGTATTVSAGENCPRSVVTGGGRILWANEDVADKKGKIRAWSVGGIDTLATNQGRPGAVATDGIYAYWGAPVDGTIMRAPFDGGAPETLVSGVFNPGGVMRSGELLYFTSKTYRDPLTPGTTIHSVPAAGGEVKTVHEIGVDVGVIDGSTSFYWYEPTTGLIKRLAKPI